MAVRDGSGIAERGARLRFVPAEYASPLRFRWLQPAGGGGACADSGAWRKVHACLSREPLTLGIHSQLTPGMVVDSRFEIEGEIGVGGMGRVFSALDTHTRDRVALKVVVQDTEDGAARFARECALLGEISHPGIVRFVASGALPRGGRYLAMEWLRGADLAEYLRAFVSPSALAPTLKGELSAAQAAELTVSGVGAVVGPTPSLSATESATVQPTGALSHRETLILARRLASAVAELHRRGVVHRDIKPGNVFLVEGLADKVKLLDLGAARQIGQALRVTAVGGLVGTPLYMSPEQAQAAERVGPETDLWAIGAVLYQCITGVPPFPGNNVMAVLAKIVAEDPPAIAALRPDAPRDLAELVLRLLEKDPAKRPRDAVELEALLDQIGTLAETRSEGSDGRRRARLTGAEQRVGCVLLAGAAESRRTTDQLTELVAGAGGELVRLLDGSLLVVVPRGDTPKDEVAHAARVALALRAAAPEFGFGVALGRLGGAGASEAVDRSARQLAMADSGQVRLDLETAGLLEAHFELAVEAASAVLLRARAVEETRTLLGRPSKWVGRGRELARLRAAFDECVEESTARVVLVTAAAGMGKTRLRLEFLRSLRAEPSSAFAESGFEVLYGQADALSAGAPFMLLGPAIRRSAGVVDGQSSAAQQAKLVARVTQSLSGPRAQPVAALLGEIVGVPFSDEHDEALRAARKDPMLRAELIREAWLDWLRAECAHRPLLLILEDLHWGDLPSLKLIDAALAQLEDCPLLVVALARPEVHTAFPQLWSQRTPEELRLHALSKKAGLELVRDALHGRVPAERFGAIVDQAGGNAFFLEELVRAAHAGEGARLPQSVIGAVQARLDSLGAEAKRVLRAASVFGEVFWKGGVELLVGQGGSAFDAADWLAELCDREVIVRQPETSIPGELEYKFRHALVRDSAYELLTPEDVGLGHALAGSWLEGAGVRDAVTLAEHYLRGDAAPEAARWFALAASQALDGNDLDAVARHAGRALAAGAGETAGELYALKATAAYWQSAYQSAREHGERALSLLPEGSARWFEAASSTIVSCARSGDYTQVDRWLERAMHVNPQAGALQAQLVCLCRGTFQLIFNARFAKADQLLIRIAELAQDESRLDALTLAQVHHVQGVRAAHVGDVALFLRHLSQAVSAFERAGDTRNVCLERTTVAWCHGELGDWSEGARICRQNLEFCRRIGASQALTYAKVNMGFILAGAASALLQADSAAGVAHAESPRAAEQSGLLAEAERYLNEAISECAAVGNQRLEGWAHAHLTAVFLLSVAGRTRGEREPRELQASAALHAELAVSRLSQSPGLKAWALGLLAEAQRAQGQLEAALASGRAAMKILEELGGLLQGEAVPPLVLARVLSELQNPEASAVIQDATARLARRAARITDPAAREAFMALRDNWETTRLAQELVYPQPPDP